MKRTFVCLAALALVTAGRAAAQECRTYRNGQVVICDDHGRDRARRERDRARRERDRERERRAYGGQRWARGPAELGVRGGYDFEGKQGTLGAQVRLPVVRQFAVSPSMDAFLGTSSTRWQVNLDGLIRPRQLAGLYFGGGGALLRRDFNGDAILDTRIGYNLLAGLEGAHISGTALRPFAEARWTGMGGFHAFRLTAGVNVPFASFGRWGDR